MSKEYLNGQDLKPEKKNGFESRKNTILLSVILVLVLAFITSVVIILLKSKNKNEEAPSESQSVVVTEQTNPHKTGGLPQAGGELPIIGSSSASSNTQNTVTVAPSTLQPQTDPQGKPQTQAGQSTPQEYLDEIKDRWGDVIDPTIDEDGDITIEGTDGTDAGLFGFKYSTKDKCFITAEEAWQRNFGYNETYDVSSPAIAITYDTIRVYFEYDGLEWMIQYWKGQYGSVLIGAEIGIYNRPVGSTASARYECISDDMSPLQSMDVYRRNNETNKYNKILSRSPSYTWWCTGFIPGTLAAGQHNVEADATRELKVDSKMTFKTPEMAQAFMAGLRKVDHIYHNAPQVKPIFKFNEMASVAEYEASNKSAKFCLEKDGVTVRVCWR